MLTWTRHKGSWFGNGFRIENRPPDGWLLFDRSDSSGEHKVYAEPVPLAAFPTLSGCKYGAERLHHEREMGRKRRRLGVAVGGLAALTVIISGMPMVALTVAAVGAAGALELAMTWVEPHIGDAQEISQ